MKNNLEVAVINSKEEKNRVVEKLKQAEGKARKYQDALNEAKRKQKIIQDKNNMIDMLSDQLSQTKQKATTAEKYYQQNKELVTRKCALESCVKAREKTIQELNDKVARLEKDMRQKET